MTMLTSSHLHQQTLHHLLSLPLEIRELIYKYLCPPARLPTILRSRRLGVSSVTNQLPPLSLLLACQQLHNEALDVYFRTTTFKIEGAIDTGNVWCLWQVEEVLGATGVGTAMLRRMRKVELCFFWHMLPEGGVRAGTALANVGGYGVVVVSEAEKRRERVQRVVDVLARAESLRTVVVSWKEVPRGKGQQEEESDAWEVREQVLKPLEKLRGVRYLIGECVTSEVVEDGIESFVRRLDSRPKTRELVPAARPDVGSGSTSERTTTLFPSGDGQYLRTPQEVDRKRSYFE